MKFGFFILFFFSLAAHSNDSRAYSALAEMNFFNKLQDTPQFKQCFKKFDYKTQSKDLSDCIIKQVSYKDNMNELDRIFKDDPAAKTQSSKLKKEKYIQTKLKEKLQRDILGKNLNAKELEKAFKNSYISTEDLYAIYKRQLEKNQIMHLSNFCLFQNVPKSNENYDQKVLSAFKKLEQKGYDVEGSIDTCFKKIQNENCQNSTADICLLNTKLKAYAKAIDSLDKSTAKMDAYFKGEKPPYQHLLNGSIIDVNDAVLDKATTVSSEEIVNIYNKNDKDYFSDQAALIQKYCINNFNKKECEKLVDHNEHESYKKLQLKIELKYRNQEEKIQAMTLDELQKYIKKTGLLTKKELEKFDGNKLSELQKTISTIFKKRKEAILSSLKDKIEDRSKNIENKNYSTIQENVAKKPEVIKSLIMFNNILSSLKVKNSNDLEREMQYLEPGDKKKRWLQKFDKTKKSDDGSNFLKDLFSF